MFILSSARTKNPPIVKVEFLSELSNKVKTISDMQTTFCKYFLLIPVQTLNIEISCFYLGCFLSLYYTAHLLKRCSSSTVLLYKHVIIAEIASNSEQSFHGVRISVSVISRSLNAYKTVNPMASHTPNL